MTDVPACGGHDVGRHFSAAVRTAVSGNSAREVLAGRGWLLPLALLVLIAVVSSLTLVWLSIERMDLTYFLNIQQSELREKEGLSAKLEVERERLLSPYELRQKAEQLGMKEPRPGQIRCMSSIR